MFTLNPDYALPETGIDANAPRLDNLRSSSKNRVGDFFSETSDRVGSNEPVTLIVTIEITVYRYETASGVHNYLYANVAPVSYIDPSGLFSVGDAVATAAIIGILSGLATNSFRDDFGNENKSLGPLNRAFLKMVGIAGIKDAGLSFVGSLSGAGPFLTPFIPFVGQGAELLAALTITAKNQICMTYQVSGLVGLGAFVSAGVGLGVDAIFKDIDREGVKFVGEAVAAIGLTVGLRGSSNLSADSVGLGRSTAGPTYGAFVGAKFGIAVTGCARGPLAVLQANVRAGVFFAEAIRRRSLIEF